MLMLACILRNKLPKTTFFIPLADLKKKNNAMTSSNGLFWCGLKQDTCDWESENVH